MTLTTLTPVDCDWNPSLNDVQASPAQNSKSVECQLERTYELLAVTEANIEMFNTLIKLNLATNDVSNFLKKQTIHKRVDVKPDLKVLKHAMRSKLTDACAFSKRLRRKRDVLKSRVAKKLGTNSNGRRVLEDMVKRYRVKKKAHSDENSVKIDRIKQKNQLEKSIRLAPPRNGEIFRWCQYFHPLSIGYQTGGGCPTLHLRFQS